MGMAMVELLASFHDLCRVNEYTDHDHGRRGADLAVKLQGRMLEANTDEMNLLGCRPPRPWPRRHSPASQISVQGGGEGGGVLQGAYLRSVR